MRIMKVLTRLRLYIHERKRCRPTWYEHRHHYGVLQINRHRVDRKRASCIYIYIYIHVFLHVSATKHTLIKVACCTIGLPFSLYRHGSGLQQSYGMEIASPININTCTLCGGGVPTSIPNYGRLRNENLVNGVWNSIWI